LRQPESGHGLRHHRLQRGLTPEDYSLELTKPAEEGLIQPDSYSIGATMTALEQQFATLLGKQRALFAPTGTLANHLATRRLAENDRRVLVQAENHLYNDCGDCAGALSGLNLIPLALTRATFTRTTSSSGLNGPPAARWTPQSE
jgi:threonine aldolase